MKSKLWHVILAVGVVVIGIYVYHMLSAHKGAGLTPGV